MSTLQLDAFGDLDLSSRNLVLQTDRVDVCATTLSKAFGLFRGTWFIDQNEGFPWLQSILGQKPNDMQAIASLFRQRCMQHPGALSAEVDIAYDSIERRCMVVFEVRLDEGTAEGAA